MTTCYHVANNKLIESVNKLEQVLFVNVSTSIIFS